MSSKQTLQELAGIFKTSTILPISTQGVAMLSLQMRGKKAFSTLLSVATNSIQRTTV
jgi:hypothetical protein